MRLTPVTSGLQIQVRLPRDFPVEKENPAWREAGLSESGDRVRERPPRTYKANAREAHGFRTDEERPT